ncbi:hypothetical protein G7Y89_g1673 [Cudoniella acicularis]|uniref:Uncharacterized protein n=1 Tax=Cudoniella acicularis TaxID=354080 RepID=A0A8H4RVL3_9HELO|nr:hypothetical protein G7Y89_g1673 [Cudoniella acicularis]
MKLLWEKTLLFLSALDVALAGPRFKTPRTAVPVIPLLSSASSPSPTSLPTLSLATPTFSALLFPEESTGVVSILPIAPQPTAPVSLDDLNGDQVEDLQGKWHLTTYYTCVTLGANTDCGWHEPVLPGGTDIAWGERLQGRAYLAGVVAAGVGGLLVG